MKDILASHPLFAIITAPCSVIISITSLSPFVAFLTLCMGCCVTAMTLYGLIEKRVKERCKKK
jgi:hypothetical protein